jgi:hypothetical protein
MPERPQSQPDEAMVDLLIKQITEGLSPAEQRELDVLDSAQASSLKADLERAAAAVVLAGGTGGESLPQALGLRVASQAQDHFASIAKGSVVDFPARSAAPRAARPSPAYGWFAAAACLVLALLGWLRSPAPQTVVVEVPPAASSAPSAPPSLADQRAALMAKGDTLKVTLGATKDPGSAGVSGDVVWDPVTQTGFMHFSGLAANDPAVHQYQLWIFDGARDQRYPVDGGVFDIPADASDVVIPIRAALMVHKPAAFAVTVEKPGGTVVSGREHVVALGAAG